MQKLQKTFLMMVRYAILGIIVGGALGFLTAFILNSLYGSKHPAREFFSSPAPVAAGALFGGVVSAVLVIKMSRNEP